MPFGAPSRFLSVVVHDAQKEGPTEISAGPSMAHFARNVYRRLLTNVAHRDRDRDHGADDLAQHIRAPAHDTAAPA